MMKIVFQLFISSFISSASFSQHIAVSADKNNVLYVGVDNPITVVAENSSCKDLIIKTNNGKITGKGCQLIFRASQAGSTEIIVVKKNYGKLKKIGRWFFWVKRIPSPSFKIGPYGSEYDINSERKVQKIIIANQQYVRAELLNFDIDVRFVVDSFHVSIFFSDSCKSKSFFNTSNKINQQITEAFFTLKKDDIVIFSKIYAKGPYLIEWELDPLILTIEK
jgi:GldM C-terminal domain